SALADAWTTAHRKNCTKNYCISGFQDGLCGCQIAPDTTEPERYVGRVPADTQERHLVRVLYLG
ncbi:MAG TPA: hypothetical protein VH640_11495, partial [Bryobacteraceae bacterium]